MLNKRFYFICGILTIGIIIADAMDDSHLQINEKEETEELIDVSKFYDDIENDINTAINDKKYENFNDIKNRIDKLIILFENKKLHFQHNQLEKIYEKIKNRIPKLIDLYRTLNNNKKEGILVVRDCNIQLLKLQRLMDKKIAAYGTNQKSKTVAKSINYLRLIQEFYASLREKAINPKSLENRIKKILGSKNVKIFLPKDETCVLILHEDRVYIIYGGMNVGVKGAGVFDHVRGGSFLDIMERWAKKLIKKHPNNNFVKFAEKRDERNIISFLEVYLKIKEGTFLSLKNDQAAFEENLKNTTLLYLNENEDPSWSDLFLSESKKWVPPKDQESLYPSGKEQSRKILSKKIDFLEGCEDSQDSKIKGVGSTWLASGAHSGMLDRFSQNWDEIYTEIFHYSKEHKKSPKDLKFTIIGHSLGAGVAYLAGLRLAKRTFSGNPQEESIEVYTYGPPSVFSPAITDTYNEVLGKQTYSFIHYGDEIPDSYAEITQLCVPGAVYYSPPLMELFKSFTHQDKGYEISLAMGIKYSNLSVKSRIMLLREELENESYKKRIEKLFRKIEKGISDRAKTQMKNLWIKLNNWLTKDISETKKKFLSYIGLEISESEDKNKKIQIHTRKKFPNELVKINTAEDFEEHLRKRVYTINDVLDFPGNIASDLIEKYINEIKNVDGKIKKELSYLTEKTKFDLQKVTIHMRWLKEISKDKSEEEVIKSLSSKGKKTDDDLLKDALTNIGDPFILKVYRTLEAKIKDQDISKLKEIFSKFEIDEKDNKVNSEETNGYSDLLKMTLLKNNVSKEVIDFYDMVIKDVVVYNPGEYNCGKMKRVGQLGSAIIKTPIKCLSKFYNLLSGKKFIGIEEKLLGKK